MNISKSLLIATTCVGVSLLTSPISYAAFAGSKDAKIASYVLGYNLGYYYQSVNSAKDIEVNVVTNGLNDGLQNQKPLYTQAQMSNAMITLQKAVKENWATYLRDLAKINLQKSSKFMKEIAHSKDARMIQDGLYYTILTEGKGEKPTSTDLVTVNYQATLPNAKGVVVYDTFVTGKPETFEVNKAIPGWQKALPQMPVGSVWTIYVAPNLAYGENAPATIGPNQALVYKMQLIAVKPGK